MVQEEVEPTLSQKIFLIGLPADVTKSSLSDFFAEYGKVSDVILKKKGSAYVVFDDEEIVNKLLQEKSVTIDDKKVDVKKAIDTEGGQKDEEPIFSIPKEALKCYVCKRDKFPSVEAYLNHKKGKQHQAVLKIFKAKSASVYQLLKAESKLAADRTFDKDWIRKGSKILGKQMCTVCQCQLNCNPDKHNKSMEHKMVVNYNNQKCCDIQYTDRAKYEAHMLSLRHLKTVYEKEQKNDPEKDETRLTMKKAIDIYKQCDQDLKELKENYPELDLKAELPSYDSNSPLGLNFIVKKINYVCMCCDMKFFAHVNLVEPHCRSYDHYINMTDYITNVEKKLAQKRKNEGTDNRPNKKRTLSVSNKAEVKKKEEKEETNEDTKKKTMDDESADVKPKSEEENGDDGEEVEDGDEQMDTVEKSDNEGDDQQESKDAEDDEPVCEDQEEMPEEEQEDQEEVADENQEDPEVGGDDSDVVPIEDEEQQTKVDDDGDAEIITLDEAASETPVDDTTKDVEEVEEEPEPEPEPEVEEPKPTPRTPRGRRARGRGRGLKR